MKKMDYKFLDTVRGMPPLKHTHPGKIFDIMNSEVAAYLVDIPAVRQKVFDMAINRKVIVYDSSSGTWHGSDWEG